jgi:hypothetical protein
VLAADKALEGRVDFRPTPTPPGLSADICGMSIELLKFDQKDIALSYLTEANLEPMGIHVIE